MGTLLKQRPRHKAYAILWYNGRIYEMMKQSVTIEIKIYKYLKST